MNSEVVCNNEIFDHNELIQDDMHISQITVFCETRK